MRDVSNEAAKSFEWLTRASVAETKYYAPKSSNETLLRALNHFRSEARSKGKLEVIRKEIYSRIESGDIVALSNSICAEVIIKDRYGIVLNRVKSHHPSITWRDIAGVIPHNKN